MKRRWFNFRPLCVIFMFLLLGSLFAFFITKHIVLSIIGSVLVLFLLILITIIKKQIIYLLVPAVSFIIGLSVYQVSINNFTKDSAELPQTVSARIYQINIPSSGKMMVYADSVKFDDKKVNSNVIIYIYDKTNLFYNIEVGSVIEFEPFDIHKMDILNGEIPNSYYFNKKLKYALLTSNVKYIKTDYTFAEIIKDKIKDNLTNGLSNDNSEISYSALFGDKSNLSSNIKQAFQISGIAHILAVSGLHVGIIVGLLYWILTKCKIKGWIRLSIVSIILIFYCYICNFSVSVLRATIMSILLLIAPLVKKQYDVLNAISIAGIIIFFINPLSVFDISFLMSFSCVLGITFISKPIAKTLTTIRAPKFIAETLAVCSATSISLIFIQAFFFKTLNLVSILANFILIPIFTFAFSVIFCLAFLSLLIPFVSYLLMPINYIFNFISIIAFFISNLSFANIDTKSFNYFLVVIYFYFLMIIGRICTAHKREKVALTLPLTGLIMAMLI